jgi:hypothetical protein
MEKHVPNHQPDVGFMVDPSVDLSIKNDDFP